MAKQLTISLFGSPSVAIDEEPVKGFISNKAVALVYYLAATGRVHGRDVLAALLWGEFPEAKAKKNLRDVLSNLRQVMDEYVRITRQTVELNRDMPIVIDVETFLAGVGMGGGRDGQLADTAVSLLRSAVDVYEGPFLDGFYPAQAEEYEVWLQGERERLAQMAAQMLHHLVIHFGQKGEYAIAIEYAGRLLALEPWREETHRQMMRLLVWSGQRTAALNQYETCYRILERELGIEPEAETTALYEQIIAGEIAPQIAPMLPPGVGEAVVLHNLPSHLTSFVGREMELAELLQALQRPSVRLITLSGPGGVGKTRLALQAAQHLLPQVETGELFADGIYFIPMTAVETADLQGTLNPLVTAIGDALQLSFVGSADLVVQLQNYLREKTMLLVVDNFEHLLAAATFLTDLLQVVPGLKLLVTSRGRLNLRGEWVQSLSGLAFPLMATADLHVWQSYSAVQLFRQTAQTVEPDFELRGEDETAVIRICHLVEGLPLGVELAATWVRFLGINEIADEIEQNISFLASPMRDVPERHRSLRAVFDYSWNLLPEGEQQVLRQLSVFRGPFERKAAAAVAGASLPLLVSLVDSSLVRRIVPEQGQVRYELLEVVRQYAMEKLALAAVAEHEVRERHCGFYLSLLAGFRSDLQGAQQREALQAIAEEIENMRAAWRWAILQKNLPIIDRAMTSLFHFYDMRGGFAEGEDVFRRTVEMGRKVVAVQSSAEHKLVWGKLLARQGWFAFYLGRQREAGQLLLESLQVLRPLAEPSALPFTLNYLGAVEYYLGHYESAQQLCQESLALTQALGDRYGEAIANNISGQLAYRLKQFEAARQFSQSSLAIEQEIGNRWSMGFSLANLGNVAYVLGDYAEADVLFRQGLAIAEEMGDPRGIARCLNRLAKTAVSLDRDADAQDLYERSFNLYRDIGEQFGMTTSLSGLGQVARRQHYWAQAKDYFDEALRRAWDIHAVPRVLDVLLDEAELLAELGDARWLEPVSHLADDGQTAYESLAQLVREILEAGVPQGVAL